MESILRGFEGRCLRRILGFTWEDRISNERIREITGMKDINLDIKERWWRWTGHVLRMKANRRPRQVMRWTPQGYRKRGRPKGTWRRTFESELEVECKTQYEIERLAQDRIGWRGFVSALCAAKHNKG